MFHPKPDIFPLKPVSVFFMEIVSTSPCFYVHRTLSCTFSDELQPGILAWEAPLFFTGRALWCSMKYRQLTHEGGGISSKPQYWYDAAALVWMGKKKSSLFLLPCPPSTNLDKIHFKQNFLQKRRKQLIRRKHNYYTEPVTQDCPSVGSCSVNGSLVVSITCLSFNRVTPTFMRRGSEFQAHSRNWCVFTSVGTGPSPELVPLSQILSKSCDLFSTDFGFFQLILHIHIGA